MQEAEEKFRNLLARQSKTLKQAVAEYKRRYGRDPPKGFEAWWEFAMENGVRLVDEFDGLVEDLEPFWSLTGDEFRKRAVQVRFRLVFWLWSSLWVWVYACGVCVVCAGCLG